MGKGPRAKPVRLGEKLLQIREALGLSQNGMAKHLGVAETVPGKKIAEYEIGRREPSLLVLLRYARAAGVPMDDLVDDGIELRLKVRAIRTQKTRRGESGSGLA